MVPVIRADLVGIYSTSISSASALSKLLRQKDKGEDLNQK